MTQIDFVILAYAAFGAMFGALVLWAWLSMRRAEADAEKSRR